MQGRGRMQPCLTKLCSTSSKAISRHHSESLHCLLLANPCLPISTIHYASAVCVQICWMGTLLQHHQLAEHVASFMTCTLCQ